MLDHKPEGISIIRTHQQTPQSRPCRVWRASVCAHIAEGMDIPQRTVGAKDPCKKPNQKNKKNNNGITCWKCGKGGHLKRDCAERSTDKNKRISATLKPNNIPIIDCYMPYFIDSGCTRHLVASLNTLENPHPTAATLTAVGGHPVKITHRGRPRMSTRNMVYWH